MYDAVKRCAEKAFREKLRIQNELTIEQFSEAVVQAVMAGDFLRVVTVGETSQQIVYMPYRERQGLIDEIDRLRKHLGEIE